MFVFQGIRRFLPSTVAAAMILSACGGRFLSPAAVVDGRHVSQDELGLELRIALSDPQTAQAVAGPGGERARADLTRRVLASLLRLEVVREYADARHIVVTQADLAGARQAAINQVGSQSAFDRLVAERGISQDDLRQIFTDEALITKVRNDVVARLPNPPSDPEGQDLAFQHWLSGQLAHADVFVNPRFGRFDPKTGAVLPITSTAQLG